ncbi:MAG: hypothetical protein ACRDM7_13095 [Thermoleophilaceae bacterium]
MIDTNTVEIVWTLAALAGLLVQTVLLVDAWRNLRAVYHYGPIANGAKRAIVWQHIRAGGGFLFMHTAFVALGLRAVFQPDAATPMTTGRLISVGLLIAASVMLVLIGLDEWRVRSKLRQRKEIP